ncbi:MAG: CDP-glycerol glycerophosphotransferase family protein [Methylobacillus sp.]|jgi:hypothetical protein|nr:CDP-glycerol glycerophosphotransferase family protein [Methylobacillus sp.]
MLRALKYLLSSRARRDLVSLLYHWMHPAPDILFVAGSQVDLQWIIPAYEAAAKQGLQCAFAGPGLTVPQGAAYYDISMHVLRFFRTSVFVTATSGLASARMPKRCARRVAIPHSLVSLHMAYPAGTFDGYTDIFCCGEHHYAEVEAMNRHDGITGRRPVLIGYGKYERLAATRPDSSIAGSSQKHVLIGPSWGQGNILETMGTELLARLLTEGYRVTLRPHPSFFMYGNAQVTPLLETFRDHPAFTLENSLEESIALWTADTMIADYSGLSLEFAFIRERPVLYVDVPPKMLNPGWRELAHEPLEFLVREHIGIIVSPTVDAATTGLRQLEQDTARWTDSIRFARERYWVNFGRFGEVCAEELAYILAETQQVREQTIKKAF